MSVRRLGNMGPNHRHLNTLDATPTAAIATATATAPEASSRNPQVPPITAISEYRNVDKSVFFATRKRKPRNKRNHRSSRDSESAERFPDRSSSTNDIDELQATTYDPTKGSSSTQKPHAPQTKLARRENHPAEDGEDSSEDEVLCLKRTKRASMEYNKVAERTTTMRKTSAGRESVVERGAITPTKFKVPVPTSSSSPTPATSAATASNYECRFGVHAAVSGANRLEGFDWGFFPLGSDNDDIPFPILRPRREYPEKGKDISWLRIRLSKVQLVKYNRNSQIIIIHRSMSPQEPARMGVKFDSADDASGFVHKVASIYQKLINFSVEKSEVTLDKIFTTLMVESRNCEERQENNPLPPATTSAESDNLTHSRHTRSSGPVDTPHGLLLERPRRATRQTYKTPPLLPCWTEENPRWRDHWPERLEYPRVGKNRATVEEDDIPRLDEGGWLNDNIVLCYINFLRQQRELELDRPKANIYFMNTFFHQALKPDRVGGPIKYDSVKKWTNTVDIFTYDYIVVPVIDHFHWFLAIISHPSKLLPKTDLAALLDKENPTDTDAPPPSPKKRLLGPDSPRIFTMDSLGGTHTATTRILRQYLVAEMNERHHTAIDDFPPMGHTVKNCPQQQNGCDCGVFVLGFIESFLRDPTGFIEALVERQPPRCNFEPSELRGKIRDTLFMLQKTQIEENKALAVEKKRQRALKKKQAKAVVSAPASAPVSALVSTSESPKVPPVPPVPPPSASNVVTPKKPVIPSSIAPSTPLNTRGVRVAMESDTLSARSRARAIKLPTNGSSAMSSPLKSRIAVDSPRPGDSQKRKRTADSVIPSIESALDAPPPAFKITQRVSGLGWHKVSLKQSPFDFDAMDVDEELPSRPSHLEYKMAESSGSDSETCFSAPDDSEQPLTMLPTSKVCRMSYIHDTPRGTTPVNSTLSRDTIVVTNEDGSSEVEEIPEPIRQSTTRLNTFNFSVFKAPRMSSSRVSHPHRDFRSSPGPSEPPSIRHHHFTQNIFSVVHEENSHSGQRPSTAGSFRDIDRDRPSSSSSTSGSKTDRLRRSFQERRMSTLGASEGEGVVEKLRDPFLVQSLRVSPAKVYHIGATRKRSSTVTGAGKDSVDVRMGGGTVIDMTMD